MISYSMVETDNNTQKVRIEKYYQNGKSQYINTIGITNIKLRVARKVKGVLKWYFQDKFGLTINLVGLVMYAL